MSFQFIVRRLKMNLLMVSLLTLFHQSAPAHAALPWSGPSDAEYAMCILYYTYPTVNKESLLEGTIHALKTFNETSPLKKPMFRWAVQESASGENTCTSDSDGDIQFFYPGSPEFETAGDAPAYMSLFGSVHLKAPSKTSLAWIHSSDTMPRASGGQISNTILHELGHVVGLSHISDAPSVMGTGVVYGENKLTWSGFIDGAMALKLLPAFSGVTKPFVDMALVRYQLNGISKNTNGSGGDYGISSVTSIAGGEITSALKTVFIPPTDGFTNGSLDEGIKIPPHLKVIYPIFSLSITAGAEIPKEQALPVSYEFIDETAGKVLVKNTNAFQAWGGTGIKTFRVPINVPETLNWSHNNRLVLHLNPEKASVFGVQEVIPFSNNRIEYILREDFLPMTPDFSVKIKTPQAWVKDGSKYIKVSGDGLVDQTKPWPHTLVRGTTCDLNPLPLTLEVSTPDLFKTYVPLLFDASKMDYFDPEALGCLLKYQAQFSGQTVATCSVPVPQFSATMPTNCQLTLPSNYSGEFKIMNQIECAGGWKSEEKSNIQVLNLISSADQKSGGFNVGFIEGTSVIQAPKDLILGYSVQLLETPVTWKYPVTALSDGTLSPAMGVKVTSGGMTGLRCYLPDGTESVSSKVAPCDLDIKLKNVKTGAVAIGVTKYSQPETLHTIGIDKVPFGKYELYARSIHTTNSMTFFEQTPIQQVEVIPATCTDFFATDTPLLFDSSIVGDASSGKVFAVATGLSSDCAPTQFDFEMKPTTVAFDGAGLVSTQSLVTKTPEGTPKITEGKIPLFDLLSAKGLFGKPYQLRVRMKKTESNTTSEWMEFSEPPIIDGPTMPGVPGIPGVP